MDQQPVDRDLEFAPGAQLENAALNLSPRCLVEAHNHPLCRGEDIVFLQLQVEIPILSLPLRQRVRYAWFGVFDVGQSDDAPGLVASKGLQRALTRKG